MKIPKVMMYGIIAVAKANGMGLDLVKYANFLVEYGISTIAVAEPEEALKLRKNGINIEILLMSPTIIDEELKLLVDNDITLTIGSLFEKEKLQKILEESGKTANVHMKIDTGFSGYGFLYIDKKGILEFFNDLSQIKVKGIYTHFSNPRDEKWTNIQFERFKSVLNLLKENNLERGIAHASSSTAFLKYPEMYLDSVRIGSVLQGRVLVNNYSFKKIGTFKSCITEIKEIPKGSYVSYSNTIKTKRATKIAVIPVGYYDGFNKKNARDDFSFKNNLASVYMEIKKLFKDNRLKVTIGAKKYNVLGRLGMYHSIVDISNSTDINVGDEVIIDVSPLQANEEIRREYV